MDNSVNNITELNPEQRAAAEKLLGLSLADYHNVAIKVMAKDSDIEVRFIGHKEQQQLSTTQDGWNIPACFRILSDLDDKEQAEYESALSLPVKLSSTL